VSFEPFEPRDHYFAGRESVPVLAWDSDRRENLEKPRLCGRRLARIPSGGNDLVAKSLFRRARRAHLPPRIDARCPADRPLSRPAASDWRAQPQHCSRGVRQGHQQELNAWEAPIRSPQLFNPQHKSSCRDCHSGNVDLPSFPVSFFGTVYTGLSRAASSPSGASEQRPRRQEGVSVARGRAGATG
jgi:hypothetical protein